jgi:DNA-binding transcriptional ArsR family regulator
MTSGNCCAARAPMSSYDKEFTRARLRAADDLRRNRQLTAAARLVGLEILACMNRVSRCAFPAEETIARRLGITGRTVRTAIGQLRAAGYIKVMRRGRSDVYFPAFLDRTAEHICHVAEPALPSTAENSSADTGKKQPATPEKNNPLTLSNNPIRTLASQTAASLASADALRLPAKVRQKAENEIAEIIGWPCLLGAPTTEAEDLCRRWPHVDSFELLEFKRKHDPPS